QSGDDANDDQSGNGQSQSGDDANDDQSGNGQSQSGDDANDDQSGNGQSQSGDDANDDQSGNGQSNAFDNSSSQGDQQSNSNATQSSQNAQAIKDVLDGKAELDETSDAGKALAEKLSNQSKEDVKNGKVNPSDLQDANRANASNIKEKVMRSDHRYVPMLTQSAEKQTVYVRNRIRNLIAAKQLVHVSRKTSGRRLISTAGTRLATGDSRVFRKKEQVKLTNTAITILLDDSGSMDGERGQVASIATQAIIQALSTVNFVKTSVLTFGSDNANAVYRVKNFDESPYRCVQRLSSHLCANGCYTPLLQGLWGGLKELSQRQEQRKVMLVITDGAPDNRVACRDLISRIRKSSDCEVFGIGIGDADQLVKPLFGDKFAVSVSNIDNLADEIFKLSEQILIK
ncbi:cobaltochelatase CobT-related protein, partial [Photobacterium leiognathi]|uniref:cobaltochelatase CobT-related protein n=1 Tax=Photobacterium leiognathi TaxID=553611 RepID=UPI00298281EC